MPESGRAETTKDLSCELPNYGVFVGREWELAELGNFLSDKSSPKCIMLVYGPRGVGKSALVREAAGRSIEDGLIKAVVWLDRSRASEILLRDDKHELPLPGEGVSFDLKELSTAESYQISRLLMSKRDGGDELDKRAIDFLKAILKDEPYLLVIDDFDEYDGLGNDPDFCEQLTRIQAPNRVILTTRLLEHKFPQRVFETLEIGVLEQEEVKELVSQCGLDRLDPVQFMDGDFHATADYIWKESGGMPEFITRFLIPLAEQRKWLLGVDPEWAEAFGHFSAGYLIQREQTNPPEEYERTYSNNREACLRKLHTRSEEERYILLSLAYQEEAQALDERELAQTLGYRPDNTIDFARFHRTLFRLHKERLISRRLEGRLKRGKDQVSSQPLVWKWLLLPFARKLIKDLLMDHIEAEMNFHRKQADQWTDFVRGYAEFPQHIIRQFDRIYDSFSWCAANQEQERIVDLGKALSKSLRDLGFETSRPELRTRLIEICQQTADTAQQPRINDWQTAVEQWMLLAQVYLEVDDDLVAQNLALEFAERATRRLEKAYENGVDIDEAKWATAACLVATGYLRKRDHSQAQYWLEKADNRSALGVWPLLAHQLGKQYIPIDLNQAVYWLKKAIDVANGHGFDDIAAKAGGDLAHLYLSRKDPVPARLSAQEARKIASTSSQSEEMVELMIKTITIEAQIAYQADEADECRKLLEEALDLAKDAKLYPIVEELNRWLSFIMLRTGKFDPTGGVDKLLGTRLLWGAIDEKCPLCKKEFEPEDLFGDRLWLCPNCRTYLHIHCLSEFDSKCPICSTPYVEEKS
jgi:hypothetical protein